MYRRRAIVTCFPGPHSSTGEDCAEISAHGSPVVLGSILHAPSMLAHAWPSPVSSRSAPFSTASATWCRPRPSPISWKRSRRCRRARRSINCRARSRERSPRSSRTSSISSPGWRRRSIFPTRGITSSRPRPCARELEGVLRASRRCSRMRRAAGSFAKVRSSRSSVRRTSASRACSTLCSTRIVRSSHRCRERHAICSPSADLRGLSLSLVDTAGLRDTMDSNGRACAREGSLTVADLGSSCSIDRDPIVRRSRAVGDDGPAATRRREQDRPAGAGRT